MEDHSQAISFANSYFSLVDGLAPGLENHLSKDVVLDWFGRTIRGRENVTEFIKAHKIGSRHVFKSISPTPGINYGKSQRVTRKFPRSKIDSLQLKEELNFDKLSINDPENNNVESSGILDSEGNKTDEISMTYDLANLFSIEITPTLDEDMEENISRIKDLGGEDRPEIAESTSAVKYVEANGQIEFFKKTNKRGADLQTWRRQSKLQIAYSVITREDFNDKEEEEETQLQRGMETEDILPVLETRGERRVYKIAGLPSLGEITDISNNLVPNLNNFGGYFPCNIDFLADRDNFLCNFNAELNVMNTTAYLRTPQYVDNRLVFSKIVDKPQGNGFVFNYLIHLIIYQGNSKCRRSLSQEFEVSNNKCKKRFLTAGVE